VANESLFPEYKLLRFSRRQSCFLFWNILGELIEPHHTILDFGAGRGRQSDVGGRQLRWLSRFKGRAAKLIGVDPDPVVLQNPFIDEAHVVPAGEVLPLPDESVDVVYSYAVFEHVDNAELAATELTRVLKPGGWICAWTPNKWGYVAIAARLVPNKLHATIVSRAIPGSRDGKDVFPTRYKMNTRRAISRLFPGFRDLSFLYNGEPSYDFGHTWIARFWLLYMALTPGILSQGLFVVLQKPPAGTKLRNCAPTSPITETIQPG